MLKNKSSEVVVEKCGGMGHGSFGLAQDRYYVSDLNDDALSNLYNLVHQDYEKASVHTESRRSIADGADLTPLFAELSLLREFRARNMKAPRLDDALSRLFDSTVARVRKSDDDKLYEAVTVPDSSDGHIHKIKDLNKNGDGTTDEAGETPHSHNISNFICMPVIIDGYKSDHPGKVEVKVGKSRFRVTKRIDEKIVAWESEFDIFKKDDDQQLIGGIVYEPDVIDAQGDSASAQEIAKACHNYMIKSRVTGLMHEKALKEDQIVMVENFLAPVDYFEGTQFVKRGSWVMVHKVLDKKLWKEIKEDKYTGYSMAGRAVDVSDQPFGKRGVKMTKIARLQMLLKLDVELGKVLREVDGKWCVFSKDGKTKLGEHETRDEALEHLRKILANFDKTPAHVVESRIGKADDYIDQEGMGRICRKCQLLMRRKRITKVRMSTIMNKNKFKRMFGIRRSSKGHSGLCVKYSTDKKLFKD